MKPDFVSDPEGVLYFSQYLIRKGFYNVRTTTPFTAWDLEADYNNKHYYFELKVRPKVALDGKYDDSICEKHKLEATPNIYTSYLVNLFDDKMSIIPYTAPHQEQFRYCQATSFDPSNKQRKRLVSYHNDSTYLHDYE